MINELFNQVATIVDFRKSREERDFWLRTLGYQVVLKKHKAERNEIIELYGKESAKAEKAYETMWWVTRFLFARSEISWRN